MRSPRECGIIEAKEERKSITALLMDQVRPEEEVLSSLGLSQQNTNSEQLFSHSSGVCKSKIRCQPARIPVRALCLAHRQPPSCYVLTWPLLGVYMDREIFLSLYFLK